MSDGVFVQLFEWQWPDVARECEEHLGPAGYKAVQVSPPQEHIPGPHWWTRYQPVSYLIESRGGTREEFADMAARCKAAGVDIYADAIINHMADIGSGVGVAGSEYTEFNYPVPYGHDDFHHCGRNEDGRIANYQDAWEVQNCQLGLLADLDTSKPEVQAKIAAFLNDLIVLGASGLRIDAAKHMAAQDIRQILDRVEGDLLVYQEVIDKGFEPIKARDYLGNGFVSEFRHADAIISAFGSGELEALNEIGGDDWIDPDKAVVFVDNHDTQRGEIGGNVLNYKNAAAYDMATAFLLAHPYGYPFLMSSFAFPDHHQPVPLASPHDPERGCGVEWVCEHRRPLATAMVAFRAATAGTDVEHWQIDGSILSFSRGVRGHVIINAGDQPAEVAVATNMPPGEYADLVSGQAITVSGDGLVTTTLGAITVLAILSGD